MKVYRPLDWRWGVESKAGWAITEVPIWLELRPQLPGITYMRGYGESMMMPDGTITVDNYVLS